MTDIIERLRACHGIQSGDPECCCQEAADEIERLREACAGLYVENERLRAALERANDPTQIKED